METNPYEYDRSVSWIPQQNQAYAGQNNGQSVQQRPPVRQAQQVSTPQAAGATQKPRPPKSMPKVRTLELAHTLKQWIVVASFVGFGTLSGLAAFHQVGTTSATSSSSSTGQSSQTTGSSSSSNGFLHQKGENNVGSGESDDSGTSSSASNSSSSSQGSNSTSSSSTSSQPVSGTHTS